MGTWFKDHILGPDVVASRPAYADVPAGTLYSATDEGLVYKADADAADWVVFAAVLPPGGGVTDLSDLGDVNLTGLSDGEALTWDNGAGEWVPAATASALAGLTDVDLTGLADGDGIVWDNTAGLWVPGAVGGGGGGGGGVLGIAIGASVPGGTPVGTLIFREGDWYSTLTADSPAVLLTLDETTGNFLDVSGNSRDFTPGTGVIRNLSPLLGDGGKAASADGSATAGHNIGSLSSAGGIGQTGTLECVVSIPAGSVSSSTFMHVGAAANGWGMGIGNGAGGSGRRIGGIAGGVNFVNSCYDLPGTIGTRALTVHMAMTLVSHVFTFFINGWAVGSNTVSELAPGANLFVGGGPEACNTNVKIDHAAFFPTVLSDDRIREHASVLLGPDRYGPAGLPIPAGSRLLGWWDGTRIQPLGVL